MAFGGNVTLPYFQTQDKDLSLLQTGWAAQINPVITNPANQTNILKNIVLASGDNTINHLLGRVLQGWFVVGQNASATFYDKQSSNAMPDKTLVLNASGAVTINLGVF